MAALHRAEGKREIGDDRAAGVACRRIDAGWEIERDDEGAPAARRFDRRHGAGDRSSRLPRRPGAEQAVDDDCLATACILGLYEWQRERSLRHRIGSLGGNALDDADGNTGGRQRACENPGVATIVARPREHSYPAAEPAVQSKRELGRRGGSGTLHQRARWNAAANRRRVTRR